MRRLAATTVLSAALLGLFGCKGPCRELSEKLCDCAVSSVAREQCVQIAANSEARTEPTADDEALCEQKLETCDCRKIETDEGKAACGLSR
ncbi:hypothetical protein POL68_33225 [Stigmatella sp. ncwal1]|nr:MULTISPECIES: hypothetical protein [Stigmatella]ADO69408.1 conserved uncharacterized protein [Stigmatella aurantiaca DW4/3-1]MDC0713373.1 hypothetical protein [Stigmatella ashevillena]